MLSEFKNFILYGDIPTRTLVKRGLKVGANFKRQNRTIIDTSHCNLITIGNDVTMAPDSYILAHDASTKLALGYTRIGKVIIGNNVFIGAKVIIMPGVSIGDNVVIGSGSVVTRNIDSNSVAVGNPAKVVKSYNDYIDSNMSVLSDYIVSDFDAFLKSEDLIGYIK